MILGAHIPHGWLIFKLISCQKTEPGGNSPIQMLTVTQKPTIQCNIISLSKAVSSDQCSWIKQNDVQFKKKKKAGEIQESCWHTFSLHHTIASSAWAVFRKIAMTLINTHYSCFILWNFLALPICTVQVKYLLQD